MKDDTDSADDVPKLNFTHDADDVLELTWMLILTLFWSWIYRPSITYEDDGGNWCCVLDRTVTGRRRGNSLKTAVRRMMAEDQLCLDRLWNPVGEEALLMRWLWRWTSRCLPWPKTRVRRTVILMICCKGGYIDEGYRAEFTAGSCGTSISRRKGLDAIDVEFMENGQFLRGWRHNAWQIMIICYWQV